MFGGQLGSIQFAKTDPFDGVDVARGCPYLITGFKVFNFGLTFGCSDMGAFEIASYSNRTIL